jgi:FtsZ-binding cell division protein ZapB
MKREGTQLNAGFEKEVMECKRLEKECGQIVELQGFISQMKEEGSNLQMELEKKAKECERLERENEDLKNMGAEYEKLYDELDRIVIARKSVMDRLKDLFCGPKLAGSG